MVAETTVARRAGALAALFLSGTILLTGCVGQAAPPRPPVAQITDAAPCGADARPPDGGTPPPVPAAGRVPKGFVPVTVYRCNLDGLVGPQGVVSHPTMDQLDGDLRPLLKALAQPDDPPWNGPCTAIGIVAPTLWLVDARGRAIRVAYPQDGCGLPKLTPVSAALKRLTVTKHTELPDAGTPAR